MVWQVIHFGLYKTALINPWKLGGLAMYCTPFRVTVSLWDETEGLPRELGAISPALQNVAQAYRLRRGLLGIFAQPDKIAGQFFRERLKSRRLLVRVGVTTLSPDGMLETAWSDYHYARSRR